MSYHYHQHKLIPASTPAPVPPTSIRLGYWMCYLLDSSDSHTTGETVHHSMDNSTEYTCPLTGRYLAGMVKGPRLCLALCILIVCLGVFGIISNIINIMVLRRVSQGSSFNKLLTLLAVFDLLASCFAVLTAVLVQVIIDNANRSRWTLTVFMVSFLLYSLGRTGSIFLTVLVTVERYFVVAHCFRAKVWLTSRRSNVITLIFLMCIILINFPWWLNSFVMENDVKKFANHELSKYPYVIGLTNFGTIYFRWIRPVHVFIDFVLPLPLLLIFNGLLYKFIYDWSKNRGMLTGSQSHHGEIRATKMFSVVVLSLLFCHTFGIISFYVSEATGILYRELQLASIMAITFNAMINLVIYFFLSQDFRECFWKLVDSKRVDFRRSNEYELSTN